MAVRVAHLIYGLGLGGLEQLVVNLAARSRSRGLDSSILALGHDGPVRALARERGVDVELLPVDGMSLGALLGIRRALEQRNASLLHAHDLGPWLNAVAVRAVRPKTRVLATFHGDTRATAAVRLYELVARILGNFTRGVAAVSRALERRLRLWVRIAPVAFVPNGLPQSAPISEVERRTARAKFGLRDTYCIALIGRLAPEKGHRVLFESARAMGATLLVAGDGPLRDELREAAQGLDVRFLGYLEDAREVFAAADVIAIPSLTEGLPLTALEALALGRCVIASAVGELPELLAGGAGVLVPPGNAAALSEALQSARDEAYRAEIEEKARARARRCGVAAMAGAYASLYGRALSGSISSR